MTAQNDNAQHIYIDTYYIQSYLIGRGHEEEHAKKQVRKAIQHAQRNGDILIKLPFLVVAELMNNVCRNGMDAARKENFIKSFLELMNDKNIDFIPHQKKALELATRLSNCDISLDVTDALIVSQALGDKYSTVLLTNDGRLIDSPEINKIREGGDRLRKLIISESI